MTIKKAVFIAYAGILAILSIPSTGYAQSQLQQAGLVPGAAVNVQWIWFRDSGAVGGGFWLADHGVIQSISDQYVILDAGNRRHVIRWGSITYIDLAKP